MKQKIVYLIFFASVIVINKTTAQDVVGKTSSNPGWFSLGVRSTFSAFDYDGIGLGTGGQFRIQFNKRVNSDWFADYITINVNDNARSEYLHIGWSILYYPFEQLQFPKLFQPYIIAGHCFDYNKKTLLQQSSISKNRWGSAVQAGIGTHFNLDERFDVSLNFQYMIHLTKELEIRTVGSTTEIIEHNDSSLEGHLLTTISLNYKIFKPWKK